MSQIITEPKSFSFLREEYLHKLQSNPAYHISDAYGKVEEDESSWIIHKIDGLKEMVQLPYSEGGRKVEVLWGVDPQSNVWKMVKLYYPKTQWKREDVEKKSLEHFECKNCLLGRKGIQYNTRTDPHVETLINVDKSDQSSNSTDRENIMTDNPIDDFASGMEKEVNKIVGGSAKHFLFGSIVAAGLESVFNLVTSADDHILKLAMKGISGLAMVAIPQIPQIKTALGDSKKADVTMPYVYATGFNLLISAVPDLVAGFKPSLGFGEAPLVKEWKQITGKISMGLSPADDLLAHIDPSIANLIRGGQGFGKMNGFAQASALVDTRQNVEIIPKIDSTPTSRFVQNTAMGKPTSPVFQKGQLARGNPPSPVFQKGQLARNKLN